MWQLNLLVKSVQYLIIYTSHFFKSIHPNECTFFLFGNCNTAAMNRQGCVNISLRHSFRFLVCISRNKNAGSYEGFFLWMSILFSMRASLETGFSLWVGKIPWRREWKPTLVLLPGKSHEQRSLAAYSPWGSRVLDSTKYTCQHHSFP